MMGAGPERFKFVENEASVALDGHSAQNALDYFKQWLPRASQFLKHTLEHALEQQRRRREDDLRRDKAREEERLRVLGNLKI